MNSLDDWNWFIAEHRGRATRCSSTAQPAAPVRSESLRQAPMVVDLLATTRRCNDLYKACSTRIYPVVESGRWCDQED